MPSSTPTASELQHFRDMLGQLCSEGVEFLVVGGHALAAHDQPRYTGDIDIWVKPTADNAARVWRALVTFGAPLAGISERDFTDRKTVFQIGLPPQRIDIMTSITGVEFDSAWPARIEVEMWGIRVPVIGKDALIQNKLATGRAKDRTDVQALSGKSKRSPRKR